MTGVRGLDGGGNNGEAMKSMSICAEWAFFNKQCHQIITSLEKLAFQQTLEILIPLD